MFGVKEKLPRLCFQLCVCIGFLLFPFVISEISLGSKLSVAESNYWVSSNGNFAIGFFKNLDRYSVGIHFNSSSILPAKQMVVWVAGADLTVGDNSYFQLGQNGEFILFDSTRGDIVWTSKNSNDSAASAVLLDSGNLILLNKKRDMVWQSFDTPTDTLLPGQNFSSPQILRAASRNSVASYYTLRMDISGNLKLWWESNVPYWESKNSLSSTVRAILNSDGILQLLDQSSKEVWSVFAVDHNDSDVQHRFLRLDVDGNLRMYSWIDVSKSWKPVWLAIENQCNVFATCGQFGICGFNASDSPVCRCPFTHSAEPNSKCLFSYGSACKSGSFMAAHEHTSLYGIYSPNDTTLLTSLQQCRSLCREDPQCTAATFMNDGTAKCRIMRTQYITGQSDPSLSSLSFVKSCSDPIAVIPLSPSSSSTSQHGTSMKQLTRLSIPCLIGIALGTSLVLFLIQIGLGFWIYRRRKYKGRTSLSSYRDGNSKGLITLSYSEIKDLTGNFEDPLGPKMFKGLLLDYQPVAVKEMQSPTEGRKFRSDVLKIGSIHHKYIAELMGYCSEGDHRFLVYEYTKNGSLRRCLEDPKVCKSLTWKKRMDISLTVAKAISYLHTGCREFVCHGNLTPNNVILDENLDAKVSEFGFEGICGEASAESRTAEKDMKDYGAMLLELMSGRQEGDGVCEWAYENWSQGQVAKVADGRIECQINLEELEIVLKIAFWCLQVDERMRPSMGEVIMVLERTLTVDPPPPPFISQRPVAEGVSETEQET